MSRKCEAINDDDQDEDGSKEMKKAKGIKNHVVKKDIQRSDYMKFLQEEKNDYHQMASIRSYNHQVFTIKRNKKPLTPYDD